MKGSRGTARATLLALAGTGAMLALVATASGSSLTSGAPGIGDQNPQGLIQSTHCSYRASLFASPQFAMVGSAVTLTTHVVVVTGAPLRCMASLSYQYAGLPAGIVSANLPVLHGSPMASGVFHPMVVVHVGSGGYLVATVTLSVGAPA